jgi:DNA-binding response OmpR family regulator
MLLTGQRILLVEDDSMVAFDLQNLIREAGGQVIAYAETLTQAMELADTPDLSLAVLDFSLESHDSLPVAAKLHARGIPFIFHTGCDRCLTANTWPFVPVVQKPANRKALLSALTSVAARSAMPCSNF